MPLSKTRDITLLCQHSLAQSEYALFRIAPFRKGQALTLGSTLRRILLQEVGSFACTNFALYKPNQTLHDFSVLPGIQETLPQIVQRIRGLRFRLEHDSNSNEPPPLSITASLNISGRQKTTVQDFCFNGPLVPCDPEQPILTVVSPYASFECEITISYAKTYVGCIEQSMLLKDPQEYLVNSTFASQPVLSIPLASEFAPIQRVNYVIKQSDMYEYILLELWTDKSITPSEALGEASVVLKQLLQPFV